MLRFTVAIIIICASLLNQVSSIPKPNKSRAAAHNKDLSNQAHFVDGAHNPNYDHEAFLGEDEAKTFDELTPEESRERLSLIVLKIDKDADGYITRDELKQWIQYTQRQYIEHDVDHQWKTYNSNNKKSLTWDDYKNVVYGFMDNFSQAEIENEHGSSYQDMLRRDQRRWTAADTDGNTALTREEFMNFLHPENAVHMRDIVVTETMEDVDKDKDGKISLQEYIGDMYTGSSDEDEPEWVKNEKEQFAEYRDKNKDGYMDAEEVKHWIIPPEFDHADAEAKHLINESDADNDDKLTMQEILDKYDLFVGSQATDFGEALTRHDEF